MLQAEWFSVRNKRDQLLRETDFTQLTDSPLTEAQKAEVVAYRQQLRDIPNNHAEPWVINWPVKPKF